MRIGEKDILSPQHQLYKNTKDIEYLFAIVKKAYKSTVEISTSSSTISQSNTNVPDGTTKGWLLDPVGNLFSITGVLEGLVGIEFYSNIKGPKGDTGATGASLINVQIVQALPATGDPNTIYFVQNQDGESGNLYDEYIYTNNTWEKLGPAVLGGNLNYDGRDNTGTGNVSSVSISNSGDISLSVTPYTDNVAGNEQYITITNAGVFINGDEVQVNGEEVKSIPTITITLSQMLSANTAQLTNEQFEIIENNSFINVVLPTGASIGFNRLITTDENYYLAMCMTNAPEITYFTCYVNSTTKVVTVSAGDLQVGGGTKYQHNISMLDATYKQYISFAIISDSDVALTKSDAITYIKTNFNSANPMPCNAVLYYGNVLHIGTSLYINTVGVNNYFNFYGTGSDGALMSGNITTETSFSLIDKVIPL